MARFGLPDIDFFEKDPEQILQEMIYHVSEKTGQTYQQADPRRKFIEGLAYFVSLERNRADYALKQTLLSYAADDALDHKGDDMDTPRLQATAAMTKIQFTLEQERTVPLTIPAGTLFNVGETYFETTDTHVVDVGVNTYVVDAVCTETGTVGNGYLPGEITTLVDPLPYVQSVVNITETAGGTDIEQDDSYAERIHLAPERFSVAGPTEAYKYWARTASQDIIDVEVTSPSPGIVHITILLTDGELPTQTHIDKVIEICSSLDIRPLTDNVTAGAPEIVSYTPTVKYWINRNDSTVLTSIQNQVNQAFNKYLLWQKSKLGRAINPSKLIKYLSDAGAYKIEIEGVNYTVLQKAQVAKDVNPTITFMGLIDE